MKKTADSSAAFFVSIQLEVFLVIRLTFKAVKIIILSEYFTNEDDFNGRKL